MVMSVGKCRRCNTFTKKVILENNNGFCYDCVPYKKKLNDASSGGNE